MEEPFGIRITAALIASQSPGVDGSRTAEPSSKVFAAFGARRELLSTTRSLRLDAGRFHDRQEARVLSIAECLDLDLRGRGAKIVVARGRFALMRTGFYFACNASGRNFPRRNPARLVAHDDIHVVVHSVQAPKQTID